MFLWVSDIVWSSIAALRVKLEMTQTLYKEIETRVEELSAVLIKKSTVADAKNLAEAKKLLFEVYNIATEEPYSFLFINLMKPGVNDMFYKRFDAKLVID